MKHKRRPPDSKPPARTKGAGASLRKEQAAAAAKAEAEAAAQARLRSQVETMAGLGLTHVEMGHILGIGSATIERNFKAELERGAAVADLAVTKNLYRIATGDTAQAVSAAIFWKKVRSRWHEVQRIIHGFDPGIVRDFVGELVKLLRAKLPDRCPHCKTSLELRGEIVNEIRRLSALLESGLPEPQLVPKPPTEDLVTPAAPAPGEPPAPGGE